MQTYKTKKHLQDALNLLAENDKPLAAAYAEYGVPPMRARPDGFEGLTRLLISQQVSTAAATAIQARFDAAIGEINAVNLLAMSDADLSACGISRPKQRYLRGLAEAVVSDGLDLAALRRADNATVYDTLVKLTGIGPWTAQCYLLFSLRRADIFPSGDLALQQAVRLLYGLDERPDAAQLADFATRWADHRGAAARLLWLYYNGEQAKKR
jgi:DNA-3-methyladenine glycosylase II